MEFLLIDPINNNKEIIANNITATTTLATNFRLKESKNVIQFRQPSDQ